MSSSGNFAAGCLVFCIEINKFLLIKRSAYVDTPNTWALAGGSSEPFELPFSTALRELKEETEFKEPILSKVLLNTYRKGNFSYFTYLVAIKNKFVPILNRESSEFRWVSLEELYNVRFHKDCHYGLANTIKENFSEIADFYDRYSEKTKSI